MADFKINTEDIRQAAEQLRRAADYVEPHPSEMLVSDAALGSSEVSSALQPATLNQTARARKQSVELDALSAALFNGAEAVEQHDQQLADGLDD